jgi:hypothetical protein
MWSLRELVEETGLEPAYFGWAWAIVIVAIAVWTFSAAGLVFVWAGLSRRHWFVRLSGASAVIAMAWLLPGVKPHRAWDLAAVFLAQGLAVVGTISLGRGLRWLWTAWRMGIDDSASRPERLRFGLRDLLLLFVVVGASIAAAGQLPEDYRDFHSGPFIVGGAAGACTLAQAWAALGSRFRWLRGAIVLVQLPALVAIWLWVARRAGIAPPGRLSSEHSTQPAAGPRWALGGLAFAIGGPVLAVWLRLALPPEPEFVPIPTPNGYDELLGLGVDISSLDRTWSRHFRDQWPPTVDEWRRFRQDANQHLDAAEAALEAASVVPLERPNELDPLPETIPTSREGRIRNVLRLIDLAAAGNVALRDPQSASRWIKSLLRLADRGAHGGLWFDYVGVAYTSHQLAARHAFDLRDQLSAEEARDLARMLLNEEPREPVERIVDRVFAWEERELGWMAGLRAVVAGFLPDAHHSARLLRQVHDRALARQRLAATELALWAFRLDRGRLPQRLDELAPQYLPSRLLDPFSAQPFVYRLVGDDYLLYSFGEDRNDDGGQPIDPQSISIHGDPLDGDMVFDHKTP